MTFDEFMQLALYDLEFGYYSAGLQKFGRHGDYITAPELTPLFGQTLARQCEALLNKLQTPIVFEFGAGSGRLCVDILRSLEQNGCLPDAYRILEVSNDLKHRQMVLVQQEIPHLAERVHWLNRWPEEAFNGVVLANEVLDAMPVTRFLKTPEALCESFITLDAHDELTEIFKPCVNHRLSDYLAHALPTVTLPYLSEANLFIDGWVKQCSNMLNQGAMILIDYGFPRHEYYHPDRNQGTLMCHHQHLAHTNPLIHIGEQDITAHVDFTHVAEAADEAGFQVAGFTNQAAFLLANGLLSLLEAMPDDALRIKTQQAVKQLIQPNEMGELFKVMALTKNMDIELRGFQFYDKRASL